MHVAEDSEVRELKFGKSFTDSNVLFHTLRYDFKPASIDNSQAAKIQIENNNAVTVSVPHLQGSGTSHTIYKGNKRPCQKECILIVDHVTGEIVLEKLSSSIQLKKTRTNSKPSAVTLHTKVATSAAQNEGLPKMKELVSSIQDSESSSSSSSSDNELDFVVPPIAAKLNESKVKGATPTPIKAATPAPVVTRKTLGDDLRLSDSDSDSD